MLELKESLLEESDLKENTYDEEYDKNENSPNLIPKDEDYEENSIENIITLESKTSNEKFKDNNNNENTKNKRDKKLRHRRIMKFKTSDNVNLNQNKNCNEIKEEVEIVNDYDLEYNICSISDYFKNKTIKIEILPEQIPDNNYPYESYQVSTEPLKLMVSRKFSDFKWLKRIIINKYRFLEKNLPHIPCDIINFNAINKELINQRREMLQRFLEDLINTNFKNTLLLYDFLSIKNEDLFEKRKK